ncbi:MAG: tRNA dihydrouridine synthase, partial [Deltaproteobacteria bacterium]
LKGLEVMETFTYDVLDFNAACPVRKVCRRGEGANLMREPGRLEELLRAVVRHSTRPVTVKLRSGWDKDMRNAPDIARLAEGCGAAAVFIHGRTREQFYKGSVDYAAIAAVKKAVRVPVIGSGDVLSAPLAKKMLDETGCDGVLVARGALGHPWIFGEIETFLTTGAPPGPLPLATILKTLQHHLALAIAEHGEKRAIKLMRKFVGWYLKGEPNIRVLRQAVSTVRSQDELLGVLRAHLPGFTPE